MHLGRWGLASPALCTLPAVQCVLLIFKLQYFTQAFRPMRFAYLDTGGLVTGLMISHVCSAATVVRGGTELVLLWCTMGCE